MKSMKFAWQGMLQGIMWRHSPQVLKQEALPKKILIRRYLNMGKTGINLSELLYIPASCLISSLPLALQSHQALLLTRQVVLKGDVHE